MRAPIAGLGRFGNNATPVPRLLAPNPEFVYEEVWGEGAQGPVSWGRYSV